MHKITNSDSHVPKLRLLPPHVALASTLKCEICLTATMKSGGKHLMQQTSNIPATWQHLGIRWTDLQDTLRSKVCWCVNLVIRTQAFENRIFLLFLIQFCWYMLPRSLFCQNSRQIDRQSHKPNTHKEDGHDIRYVCIAELIAFPTACT